MVRQPLPHGAYGARGKTGAGRQTYQNYRCKCRRNEGFANKILGYAIPKIISHLAAKANFQSPFLNLQLRRYAARTSYLEERDSVGCSRRGSAHTLGCSLYHLIRHLRRSRIHPIRAQRERRANYTGNAVVENILSASQATPGNETATRGTNTPSATTGPRKPVLVFGEMTGDFAVKQGGSKISRQCCVMAPGLADAVFKQWILRETTIANANRSWRIGSLCPLRCQFVVAALTGSGAAHISLVPATSTSVAKNTR